MTTKTLPSGFRLEPGALLVNNGPTDTAAGQFGNTEAPALWSRQVLTDGQLRAVVITEPATGPDQFQAVHATAEQTADALGVGAVEVAVCWTKSTDTRQSSRLTSAGWAVAGFTVGADLVLLVTDAVLPATVLGTALADNWPGNETVLILASGESRQAPEAAEFAATLGALRLDLACPRGGIA